MKKLFKSHPRCQHHQTVTEVVGNKIWTSCNHCGEVLRIKDAGQVANYGVTIDMAKVSAVRQSMRQDSGWGM